MENRKIKSLLDKLYEQTKHGDAEHQLWLKNKFDDFYKTEILGEESRQQYVIKEW